MTDAQDVFEWSTANVQRMRIICRRLGVASPDYERLDDVLVTVFAALLDRFEVLEASLNDDGSERM